MEENERLTVKSFIRQLEEQDILLDEGIAQNVFHVSDSYLHTIRSLFDDILQYRKGLITPFHADQDARGLRSQVRDARARLVGRLEQIEDTDRTTRILEKTVDAVLSNPAPADRRKVFVVFGRNHKAKGALFQFLQSIGLIPIEWPSVVSSAREGSPYIGHALLESLRTATAAVVLLTGDDLARLGRIYLKSSDPEEERHLTPQPRPNVFFEAGMAFTHFPTRTIVVSIGRTRKFTDILGRHIIHLSEVASRQELAETLQRADCAVEIQGRNTWHTAGDFDAADQPPDNPEATNAASLKIVRRSASPEASATYKPKIYVDIRNDAEHSIEIRHLEWETIPQGVIVKYGPSSFQLRIGHHWCPEKEGVDRLHVPPGELFRLWLQPTEDFDLKDIERRCLSDGQIAILSLQVNGARVRVPV